jgi:hypothetical protein
MKITSPRRVPHGLDADDLPDAEELAYIAETEAQELAALRALPKQRESDD